MKQNNIEVNINIAIFGGSIDMTRINGNVAPREIKDTNLQRFRVISKKDLETDSYLDMPSSIERIPRSLSVEAAMIRGTRAPLLK